MKKHFFLIVIALVSVASLRAQVSYTSAEFGNAGDSVFYSSLDSSSLNFAQAGANVNWNFSTMLPITQGFYDFLNPATAGYEAAFVDSCIAGGGTNVGCTNQFNTLTNVAFTGTPIGGGGGGMGGGGLFNNVINHDFKSVGSLIETIIGGTTAGLTPALETAIYGNVDTVYNFPISFGNQDSSQFSYTLPVTLGMGITATYKAHGKRVNIVDAWGSLITPYATYPNTIRLKSTVTNNDSLITAFGTLPVPPSTTITYSWFDPAHKAPVLTATGNIGGGGGGGGIAYNLIRYLDTLQCLIPVAHEMHNPFFNIVISPQTGYVTVNFNSTSTGANSYYWNFGDPGSGTADTSTLISPAHNYDSAGTYTIEFVACNTECQPEKCDTLHFNLTVIDSGAPNVFIVVNPPQGGCAGDTTRFTSIAFPPNTNYTYAWNFGDGSTSTLANPTHIYTTAGTYTVILTVYNGNVSTTATRTITISGGPPVVVINSSGPLVICNGDSLSLQATGGGMYLWSTNQFGPVIRVHLPGVYTVTATNACGTATASVTISVVNVADTIVAVGDTLICSGDSVMLQAGTGTGYTYQWRRNGQIIIGATSSFYYASTTGNYVADAFQDSCGGVSNVIHVTALPAPNPVITALGSTTICSSDSSVLQLTPLSGVTYQWQLNGSNISGATGLTYAATMAGVYDAVATQTGVGCVGISNSITITVDSLNTPVVTYSGNPVICSGDSFNLSTNPGSGYSYQWQLNGQGIIGANAQFYYANTTGSYDVIVTSGVCSGTSNSVALTVNPSPLANAGDDTTTVACGLSIVNIGGSPTASGGVGPYTYLWTPTAGLSDSSAANPTISNLGSTTIFQVNVTDANGCSANDTVTVTVTGNSLTVSVDSSGTLSWCSGSGGSVFLTAVVNGGTGPYNYNWSPSTGISSTNTDTTTANPNFPGLNVYTIVVTDQNGCQAGTNVNVDVIAQPVATIVALDSPALCPGDTAVLSANQGAGYIYQWLISGNPISGATGLNYSTTTAGDYSVSVTNSICSATSNTITVSNKPDPTASITALGNTAFCAGGNVELSATNNSGYTFQWYDNGQLLFADTSANLTVSDSGTFTVNVLLNGCSLLSNALSTVMNPIPNDSVGIIGNTIFCAGDSAILGTNAGSGYTYQWMLNGSAISGAIDSVYTAADSGLYDVVVTALGCTATSSGVDITVFQYPSASLTASGSLSFCTGGNVVLSASTGTGYSYQWYSFISDSIIALDSIGSQITVADSGWYNVVVSNHNCNTLSDSLYVDQLPTPVVDITASGSLVCPGDTVILTSTTGIGYSYQWEVGGGSIIDATGSTYAVTDSGTYTVVASSSGCSSSSNSIFVGSDLNPAPVITQNGDTLTASTGNSYQWYNGNTLITGATQQTYVATGAGTYTVQVTDSSGCTQKATAIILGVSSLNSGMSFEVYPNPAHDILGINYTANAEGNISIRLYDVVGNEVAVVFEGKAVAGVNYYNQPVDNLGAGVYLLRFSNGKNTITKKIIKE